MPEAGQVLTAQAGITAAPVQALRANFLTRGQVAPVRFGYDASRPERLAVLHALSGWEGQHDILAPKYLPGGDVVQGLELFLATGKRPSDSLVRQMTRDKVRALNMHNFILGLPLVTVDTLLPQTETYLDALERRMTILDSRVLTDQNGFRPESRVLFRKFVARTSPIMFTMGFPDNVDHPGEVAQRGVRLAIELGGREAEVLQSLLSGWLHDPKLHPSHSWSNLATHPVVASVIADHLFKQPDMKRALYQALGRDTGTMTPARFVRGLKDALLTNSDSRWVMTHVLLHRSGHALAEPGIADIVPQAEAVFEERFNASSRGVKPYEVKSSLIRAINRVKLSTDLRGVRLEAFTRAVQDVPINPTVLFNRILDGDMQDAALLKRIRDNLLAQPDAIMNPAIRGSAFLAHHDEVKDARLAALGIAVADQYGLSAHKMLVSGREDTAIERIQSYSVSFGDNINSLPKVAQEGGRIWQRDMYRSMLAAADELTGGTTLRDFDNHWTQQSLARQVEEIERRATDAKTWQGPGGDFATFNPDDPANEQKRNHMEAVMKRHYQTATQTSPAMFGPAPSSSSQ